MDLGTSFTNGVNTVLPNIAQWFTTIFQTMGGIFMTGEGDKATLSVVGWILVMSLAFLSLALGFVSLCRSFAASVPNLFRRFRRFALKSGLGVPKND